ncbi:MAG: HAD hydrolase family protein [Phycisphaerales bacterium]
MSESKLKYSMLAIDLDGTLLCSRGQISKPNREAIADARRQGLLVTICTGRGLIECKHLTDQIEQADPVVVAGGSMIACPLTRRTLHRFPMNHDLVRRLVNVLASHGHAVLVLKDPEHAGHDYVVVSATGEAGVDPVTRWWFAKMNVPVRYVASLDEDEHLPHTVRVGVCGPKRRTDGVALIVRDSFANQVMMQHFHAVVPRPEDDDPEGKTLILECFDRAANKWSAIEWLAGSRGLPATGVAAIGNDINDVAMLQQAALAVAMGNAIDEAKAVAHRHTLGNDEDGVAHAIEQILQGRW